MGVRTITVKGSLDLRRTTAALGMKAGPRPVATPGEAWWATRTPTGPATLRLELGDGVVRAEAWGSGRDWALERAGDLIGAHDRPETFTPEPGPVADLHRRTPGLRVGRTNRVFEAILPAILGQKVTNREARASGRRLLRRFGEPAPGPRPMVLPPSPERIAALSYWDLHDAGVERKRAVTLIEAARRADRLEEILGMDREAAHRRLTAIRGVGPWTAGHVMGIAWGDADAIPVGDYHLPSTVAFVLAGEARADDERMLTLLEPYAGHRRRVVLLVKARGLRAPRFGPGRALRSIEHI